jgi:hypothetical protein
MCIDCLDPLPIFHSLDANCEEDIKRGSKLLRPNTRDEIDEEDTKRIAFVADVGRFTSGTCYRLPILLSPRYSEVSVNDERWVPADDPEERDACLIQQLETYPSKARNYFAARPIFTRIKSERDFNDWAPRGVASNLHQMHVYALPPRSKI